LTRGRPRTSRQAVPGTAAARPRCHPGSHHRSARLARAAARRHAPACPAGWRSLPESRSRWRQEAQRSSRPPAARPRRPRPTGCLPEPRHEFRRRGHANLIPASDRSARGPRVRAGFLPGRRRPLVQLAHPPLRDGSRVALMAPARRPTSCASIGASAVFRIPSPPPCAPRSHRSGPAPRRAPAQRRTHP